MQNLSERIKTQESEETLYRGLSFDSREAWEDLRPLYDTITTVQQDPVMPTHLEAELFFIAGTRFEVVSVQRYDLPNGGKRDVYTLREL